MTACRDTGSATTNCHVLESSSKSAWISGGGSGLLSSDASVEKVVPENSELGEPSSVPESLGLASISGSEDSEFRCSRNGGRSVAYRLGCRPARCGVDI